MKSPLMRYLGMIVRLVTAFASINMGLIPFGFNIFTTQFMLMRMPMLILPMYYIIGLSGVCSVVLFFMSWKCECPSGKSSSGSCCPSCGSFSGCNCKKPV